VGLRGVDLTANAAWSHGEIRADANNPALIGKTWVRVPRVRANVFASYQPNDRWLGSLAVRHSGRQYNNLDNSDINPGVFGGTSGWRRAFPASRDRARKPRNHHPPLRFPYRRPPGAPLRGLDRQARPRAGAGAALYYSVSEDSGATFKGDFKVADHSCECCRIALALTRDGKVAAMWRHVFEPNVRDHAFAILPSDGRSPRSSA
jgi:hypothetical protein